MIPAVESIITFSLEPSVADFLKRIVEDAGFVATAIWSSIEDLENAVVQARPSVLIYEVGFPFAEKWEHSLAAFSRPAFAGVPIVIATPASAEQCRRAGAAAVLEILPRPTRDQITATIRNVLTGRRIDTPAA
jgi:DNA-binding response OmpR family regulator